MLVLDQSEDLWCLGYNMRSGATGIFPAFYTAEVTQEPNPGETRLKLEEPWRTASEGSLCSSAQA